MIMNMVAAHELAIKAPKIKNKEKGIIDEVKLSVRSISDFKKNPKMGAITRIALFKAKYHFPTYLNSYFKSFANILSSYTLYLSRNSESIDSPYSSRISSAFPCKIIRPSLRKMTSSRTDSISAMR